MDFDLSGIMSKLAIVLPYLSYIVNFFTQMFDTMKEVFDAWLYANDVQPFGRISDPAFFIVFL